MKYYTDLAFELCSNLAFVKQTLLSYCCMQSVTKIDTVEKQNYFQKPKGEYFALECPNLYKVPDVVASYVSENVANYLKDKIKQMLKKNNFKVLAVCLGNDNMICDALGKEVFERLNVGCSASNELFAIMPNVQAKTNISSEQYTQAIVKKVMPDICIVVDALCTKELSRIGTCVQVCDSGVLAGGATNRSSNALFSKKTLGVPVICIGVPMLIRAENLLKQFINQITEEQEDEQINIELQKYKNIFVCSKDVDIMVKICAQIVADSINLALS